MPVASSNVRRRLSNIIRHFKFEELETAVLPLFPEITWHRTKTKLVKHRESFSVSNVSKLIENALDECRVDEKFLKERISILEVIDVSRHHTKKTWHCYELKGSNKEMNFMTKRDIENKIIKYFLVQHVQVEVHTTMNDGLLFAGIKKKSKTQKSIRSLPVFFALLLGQKYFFCSKRTVTSDFIQAIVNSMGYASSKRVKLTGKDLPSLIKLIWQKKQGAIDIETLEIPYEDSKPVIKSTGIDFTQAHNRKDYMEKILGKESPTLESLVVDSANQTWRKEDASLKLPDKKIFVGWEYRSKNVANFLKNSAERRVLITPVPDYLSKWMTMAKNELTIQEY